MLNSICEATSLSIKARIAIKKYCEITKKSDRSWNDFNKTLNTLGITKEEYDIGMSLFGGIPLANPVDNAPKNDKKPTPKAPKNDEPKNIATKVEPKKEEPVKAASTPKAGSITIDGFQMSDAPIFKISPAYVMKRYKEFNARYFNNELPLIPARIGSLKHATGVYSYRYNRRTGEISNEHIKISTFSQRSETDVCISILHEMIHVYQIHVLKNPIVQMRRWSYAHGYTFTKKMYEINKYGWKIDTRCTEERSDKYIASPEQVNKLKRADRVMVYATSSRNSGLLACIPKKSIRSYKIRFSHCNLKFFDIVDYASFVDYPMCVSQLQGHGMSFDKLQKMIDDNKIKPIDTDLFESLENNYEEEPLEGAILVDRKGDFETWEIV